MNLLPLINALIVKLDEEAFRFLKPHENKILCFEIVDITKLYFQIKPQGLESIELTEGMTINTTLKGSLRAFMTRTDLHIRGDLECAKALYDTWQYLDCDWEGAVAEYTDPTFAHGLFAGVKKTQRWAKQTFENRTQDVSIYLQDEIRLLPTQNEVDEFIEGVETCRDDVERLQAKILAYIKRRAS